MFNLATRFRACLSIQVHLCYFNIANLWLTLQRIWAELNYISSVFPAIRFGIQNCPYLILVTNQTLRVQSALLVIPYSRGWKRRDVFISFPKSICAKVNVTISSEIRTRLVDLWSRASNNYTSIVISLFNLLTSHLIDFININFPLLTSACFNLGCLYIIKLQTCRLETRENKRK